MVDAPGHAEAEEAGAAGFGPPGFGRIVEAGAPEAVGGLAAEEFGGHAAEGLFVAGAPRIVAGEGFEEAGDAGKNPAVAAGPEDVVAEGGELGFVAEVAVVEA